PTMERLSEQQLAEIHGAATDVETALQGRLDALHAQVEKSQGAIDAQTAKIEGLREQVAAAPEDTRLAARLAKAESRLEQMNVAHQQRIDQVPLRALTAEARAAKSRGARQREMTKSITRLAEDGYGVKLGEGEAEAMAKRLLEADPDTLDVQLRATTEELVNRAQRGREATPSLPFGQTRPHEEQRAVAVRLANITRARVQRLARELGYAMPADEAQVIARRLHSVHEDEALALIDELMVRPRTLAKSLTEPSPTVPPDVPTPPEAAPPPPAAAAAQGEAPGRYWVYDSNHKLLGTFDDLAAAEQRGMK